MRLLSKFFSGWSISLGFFIILFTSLSVQANDFTFDIMPKDNPSIDYSSLQGDYIFVKEGVPQYGIKNVGRMTVYHIPTKTLTLEQTDLSRDFKSLWGFFDKQRKLFGIISWNGIGGLYSTSIYDMNGDLVEKLPYAWIGRSEEDQILIYEQRVKVGTNRYKYRHFVRDLSSGRDSELFTFCDGKFLRAYKIGINTRVQCKSNSIFLDQNLRLIKFHHNDYRVKYSEQDELVFVWKNYNMKGDNSILALDIATQNIQYEIPLAKKYVSEYYPSYFHPLPGKKVLVTQYEYINGIKTGIVTIKSITNGAALFEEQFDVSGGPMNNFTSLKGNFFVVDYGVRRVDDPYKILCQRHGGFKCPVEEISNNEKFAKFGNNVYLLPDMIPVNTGKNYSSSAYFSAVDLAPKIDYLYQIFGGLNGYSMDWIRVEVLNQ